MKFLGIDYGEKRIGLSYGDELGVAVPLPPAVEKRKKDRLNHIFTLLEDRKITALIVGYPYNMDGSRGFKAIETDRFIALLEKRFHLPVRRVDERLTTHQVKTDLRKSGLKWDRKSGLLDSRAATLILQDYLDHNFQPDLAPRCDGKGK